MTHSFVIRGRSIEAGEYIPLSLPGFEDLTIVRLPAGSVSLTHDLVDPEFYRHGWNSWSPTAWQPLSRDPWRVWNNPSRTQTAEDAATDSSLVHRSYQVGALTSAGTTLLLGSLSRGGALVDASGNELRGCAPISPNTHLSPLPEDTLQISGGSAAEDAPWVVIIGEEQRAFSAYGTLLAQELGAPLRHEITSPLRHSGPVWSSWYSWFEEVTQDIVTEEIPHATDLGYRVMQIDDGWEQGIGMWEPNDDFPDIAGLAADIHRAGMRPGLWLAPFIVTADSPLAAAHPNWLVLDPEENRPADAGFNWGKPLYALDTTHPEVESWIRSLMERACSWGFTYFKIDFIYAAAIAGRRFADISREEAYVRGIRTIREAVGDAYLLGSGALPAASLGILDGIRVGPDTAPYWDNTERHRDPSGPSVLNALRTSLSRVWWKPWIDVDPDVALTRTRGSLLSPEVNALTHDAALVCGFFGCSDPGTWLTEAERDVLRSTIARAGGFCPPEAPAPLPHARVHVEQIGRYLFTIDGRLVDFDAWLHPSGRISDRLLVK